METGYCGHSCNKHQIIMLYQLQRTIDHPLLHVSFMVICNDRCNVPDYYYGYVFQTASNSLKKCPTTNVSMTFTGDNQRRSMKMIFTCPFGDRQYKVYQPDTYEYDQLFVHHNV